MGEQKVWHPGENAAGKGSVIRKVTDCLADIIFPRRCPICDEIAPAGELICAECQKEVKRISEPTCKRCGKSVEHERIEFCYDCAKKHHEFKQGKAVFLYQKGMKQSLYRFKYSNKREYAAYYARKAVNAYGDWIRRRGVEALVPVPMYRGKQRLRGYNQAEVFAKEIGKQMQLPVLTNTVLRIRNTVPQKQLNDVERKNNLKKAFKIRDNIVKYKIILLIDDIYTTGSTMDAVSKELKKAGVEEIYFLCISIGAGC